MFLKFREMAQLPSAASTRPIVLSSPLFSINGIKLYLRSGRDIGASIFWEQQHVLQFLAVVDRVNYRKMQSRRGRLEKLCCDWSFTDAFATGDRSMGSTVVLTSPLLIVWLLRFSRDATHNRVSARPHMVKKLLFDFDEMALQGFAAHAVYSPIQVFTGCGMFCGELHFAGGAAVRAARDLLANQPRVVELWHRVKELRAADHWCQGMSNIEDASMGTWLLFLEVAVHTLRPGSEMRDLLCCIGRAVLERLCTGIELWLLLRYVPTMTGSEVVNPILKKDGSRTRRDSWSKAVALFNAQAATGSTTTFLAGALGDKHIDSAICRSCANIYLGKLGAKMSENRRWSIAWDPGGYSGHQYNVGLAWTADSKLAVTLPVKVIRVEKEK